MCNVFLSHQEIETICSLLGKKISSRYRFNEIPPVAIGLLNNGIPFTLELTQKIDIPVQIDYLQVGCNSELMSENSITLIKDVSVDLMNRDIILIEAEVDSGFSHKYIVEYLSKKYNPKSITSVALINRPSKRKTQINLDFYGKEADDEFLVGFGLEYKNFYSNTDYIYTPNEQELAKMDKFEKKSSRVGK